MNIYAAPRRSLSETNPIDRPVRVRACDLFVGRRDANVSDETVWFLADRIFEFSADPLPFAPSRQKSENDIRRSVTDCEYRRPYSGHSYLTSACTLVHGENGLSVFVAEYVSHRHRRDKWEDGRPRGRITDSPPSNLSLEPRVPRLSKRRGGGFFTLYLAARQITRTGPARPPDRFTVRIYRVPGDLSAPTSRRTPFFRILRRVRPFRIIRFVTVHARNRSRKIGAHCTRSFTIPPHPVVSNASNHSA